MSAVAEEIEEKLVGTLASSFSGEDEALNDIEELEEERSRFFDFDATFQLKIAALAVRDQVFARKVQGLISPDYFESSPAATLVSLMQDHWERYKQLPSSMSTYKQVLNAAIKSGRIRDDMKPEVIETFKKIMRMPLNDRDYVADRVAEFARHQAMMRAMIKGADLMERGKYDEAAELIKKASAIGISDTAHIYEYFESIESRSLARKDKVAGITPPQGITTGIPKIDKLLYNNGWGRGELSLLLGGAKAGKSTGLLFFARNAALDGKNVLYITLEMSDEIAASRIDASISEVEMRELNNNIGAVEAAVRAAHKKAGKLMIAQMPGYSLTPSGLRRLVDEYRALGIIFDMIVLDYMDLMTPDFRTNNPIENSKNIYVGVRAIGQEDNVAILSATQTNREGFKSVVVKAEQVADDFNKIRIADLTISINATDDERDRGEARLYFAAARNDRGGTSVQIKQDIERMIFIKGVLGVT